MTIEQMIEQHGDGIVRLCLMYLGDRQLAEDAFQETMIKAWKSKDAFRGESGEKTWLTRIAANVCRDMLRSGWFRMMRRSRSVETLFDIAAPERENPAPVRDAVLSLPGKYREVVVLYYEQDMAVKEIAALLHVSVNTVSTRLRRARMLLKKQLGEEVDA